MENARKTITEIRENLLQKSASRKDEITVMKAIMNDPGYAVDVYDKTGKCGEYTPAADIRKLCSNVVSSATKMPMKEAEELVSHYEFTKADAALMVDASKEFVNSYLQTGRKMNLGGRENSNISIMWKEIGAREVAIPSNFGSAATIPAHGGLKVFQACPSWLKKKD